MALASVPRHNLTREDVGLIHALNYGSARTDVTLQDALTAIGAEEKTLLLTPGTWTIASHRTIPDNIRLMPAADTMINVNTGITLTINGPIEAPPRQLFAGAGSVVLGRLAAHPAYGEWFGAKGDGATDDTAALSKTQDAVGVGGWIKLIAPEYRVTQWAINKADLTIEGRGFPAATGAVRIIGTSESLPVIHVNSVDRVALKRIFVNHSGTADSGVSAIQLSGTNNTLLEDVSIRGDIVNNPAETGSHSGILITATASRETFVTNLVRPQLVNLRGAGIRLQGIDSGHRVGETHIDNGFIAANGLEDSSAGLDVGDYVYGIYNSGFTTYVSNHYNVRLAPTVTGRTLDFFASAAIFDNPVDTNILSRNMDSVHIDGSWINSSVSGWGIDQETTGTSELNVSDTHIGGNANGGIRTAGRYGRISGNTFNTNIGPAITYTAASNNNFANGNLFVGQPTDISDGGFDNDHGLNHYNQEPRPRASSGIALGSDGNFFTDILSLQPVIGFDVNDFLLYDRAGNNYQLHVGSDVKLQVSAVGAKAERFYGNLGATPWTSARFTLSAGWGTTASVGTIVATDSRGYFTVTSAGTGQGANPTVTCIFADAFWDTTPTVLVNQQDGTQILPVAVTTVTNAGFVVAIVGTPANGQTFNFAFMVMG